MSATRHQQIRYKQNNTFDNHVDPSTRLSFELDEEVVLCRDKNSLMSLRSLQANGYQCPFCISQLDSNLDVVESNIVNENAEKISKPKRSPYPDTPQRSPSVQTWIGLVLAFCLLVSVGAVAITRAIQSVSQTETPNNSSQFNNNNPNTEDITNASTSVPTQTPFETLPSYTQSISAEKTPISTAYSAPTAVPLSNESITPETFIKIYFGAINDQDYKTSYSMLSNDFQANQSYNEYVSFWKTVKKVEVLLITIKSQNASQVFIYVEAHYYYLKGYTTTGHTTYKLIKDGPSWFFDPN